MSARAVRTHFMGMSAPGEAKGTDCGITGYRTRLTDDEADTAGGRRINITRNDRDVTCLRCRKLRFLPLNGSEGGTG